ncbi:hypothetical protein ACFFIX_07630 [Metabacillus herbersteinensis]|uniref:Swarming motility protein SwrB n=1 Tax=Metabacillus herbersteinensis TaxID=283816 RepID=A0ABV6GCC6_9BACI
MTSILLFISIVLHAVSFYFIIVLYTKYSTIKQLTESQKSLYEETEHTLTSYLLEVKDENQKLIDEFKKELHTTRSKTVSKVSPLIQGIEKVKSEETIAYDELPSHLIGMPEVKDIVEIKNESSSSSTQKNKLPYDIEAINLFKDGYTVGQIAKKLNKGRTEIDLLLKFRHK